MNTITMCRLVGYIFLTIVTLVEILIFCVLFNIDATHWSKFLAIILIPIIFNVSIWGIAIFYHKVKETHAT